MTHSSRRAVRSGPMLLAAGVIGAGMLATPAPTAANLLFNLAFLPATSQPAQDAFAAAAAAWSAVLADNVTVNLTVGTAALGPGILASAGSVAITTAYSTYRTQLSGDANSANDSIAVGNLPVGPSLNVLINHTLQNGGATYVDSSGPNASTIWLNNAVAKAVGLAAISSNLSGSCLGDCDGYITFSTGFSFDYDPSDGIGGGLFDFVGIAIHEIGHALGFVSGVDVLDTNAGAFNDDAFTFVAPLDLFRCTAASAAQNAIDWTASGDAKSFSLDACISALATFSTGVNFGDGRQASHWKDDQGLGIMDPTIAPGESLAIKALDLLALDVIGWNLAQTSVPAPASALVFLFGLVGLGLRRRVA